MVVAIGLAAGQGAASAPFEPLKLECVVLAGDEAVAAQLCAAVRSAIAVRPEVPKSRATANVLLDVINSAPTKISARLLAIVADERREGPAFSLGAVDRADIPHPSIIDFADTLIENSNLVHLLSPN